MNISIRKLECVMDEMGEWVENDGQNVCDFDLEDGTGDDGIKTAVISRLRDWLLHPLDIAAGKFKWENYGDDLEIVNRHTCEPLFHITIGEEN